MSAGRRARERIRRPRFIARLAIERPGLHPIDGERPRGDRRAAAGPAGGSAGTGAAMLNPGPSPRANAATTVGVNP